MLSCLERVRLGLLSPSRFQTAEQSRRTLNLSLSSLAVLEPVFSSPIFSLHLDSTSRFLLSGCSDGSWYIHDTFNLTGQPDHEKKCVVRGKRGGQGHSKAISTVEWYPEDSGLFITSSNEGKLCIWDANSASQPVDTYDLEGSVTRHQMNPGKSTLIAAASQGSVNLIDLRAGTTIQKLPETNTAGKEVRWNPRNENTLLVGTSQGHLIEWDIRSTLNYRGYGLLEVIVARRGVRTRNFTEQVNVLEKAHSGGILSIRYKSDGMEFYSMGADGRLRRWLSDTCPPTEPLLCTLNYGPKVRSIGNYSMDISGETEPPLVFAPQGPSIIVADMRECRVRNTLGGHFKQVNAFVYDNKYQVGYSGGNDASVMVWSGHTLAEQSFLQEKLEGRRGQDGGRRQRTGAPLIFEDEDEEHFRNEYRLLSSEDEEEETHPQQQYYTR